MVNVVDVIARALEEGVAEEDQNLDDYWHGEARRVWAALVEHGETSYIWGNRVLVLPMPEEPNDA